MKVPRSYYYQVSMLPSRKEPSLEELQKLVGPDGRADQDGDRLVVPMSGPAILEDDDRRDPRRGAAGSACRSCGRPSIRGGWPWTGGSPGAMGAMAAVLVLAGSWVLGAAAGRRPAAVNRGLRDHRRVAAAPPGPSERVREFVRRNPESAVSVLERWTSQGGDAS